MNINTQIVGYVYLAILWLIPGRPHQLWRQLIAERKVAQHHQRLWDEERRSQQ